MKSDAYFQVQLLEDAKANIELVNLQPDEILYKLVLNCQYCI